MSGPPVHSLSICRHPFPCFLGVSLFTCELDPFLHSQHQIQCLQGLSPPSYWVIDNVSPLMRYFTTKMRSSHGKSQHLLNTCSEQGSCSTLCTFSQGNPKSPFVAHLMRRDLGVICLQSRSEKEAGLGLEPRSGGQSRSLPSSVATRLMDLEGFSYSLLWLISLWSSSCYTEELGRSGEGWDL